MHRISGLFWYPVSDRIWLAGYPAKLNRYPYQFIKFPTISHWNRYCFDVKKKCYMVSSKYGRRKPFWYIWFLWLFHILLDIWMLSWKSGRISGTGIRSIEKPDIRQNHYPIHP
jgi:hypothetical protein